MTHALTRLSPRTIGGGRQLVGIMPRPRRTWLSASIVLNVLNYAASATALGSCDPTGQVEHGGPSARDCAWRKRQRVGSQEAAPHHPELDGVYKLLMYQHNFKERKLGRQSVSAGAPYNRLHNFSLLYRMGLKYHQNSHIL